mmetsp:Transcript_100146/g.283637  ORF Transcript_100146/g.283637 Transcript_100146/m.283637 type:complete len:258 (+) Transcript_100146:891-1664(+)
MPPRRTRHWQWKGTRSSMKRPVTSSLPAYSHATRPSSSAPTRELPMMLLPCTKPVCIQTARDTQESTIVGMQITKGSQRKSHMTGGTTRSRRVDRGGTLMRWGSASSHARAMVGMMCVQRRLKSSCRPLMGMGTPEAIARIRDVHSPALMLRLKTTYFWTLAYIFRPSRMAATIVEKSSSMRISSLAFLATSVPEMPMETPTMACFSAGASLTPSPVMAVMWPCFPSEETIATLSVGCARDHTLTCAVRAAISREER